MPAMIVFRWWESVPFVSVISVYANIVGHWSAWQAARAEEIQGGKRRKRVIKRYRDTQTPRT